VGRGAWIRQTALGLALLAAGCGWGRGDQAQVRFWNGFTGPDGRTMLRIVREFNQQNQDTRVLMQRMDWATYYNKLFVAGIGGRAPDVFIVHAGNLERFIRAGFIEPLDDLAVPENGFDPADMVPAVWQSVARDGAHHGIPLDVHMLGMYYNKRLFREAGIVDEAGEPVPPVDRASFLDAARRLTADTDNNGRTDQWGYVFTWFRTNVYAIMNQWGGRFISDDGTRCLLAESPNPEALQFCADLIRKEQVAPTPESFDSWTGFRQGKVGMVFEGIYMLSDLRKQEDLEWGAAPVPVLGERPAVWADSHVLCMRAGLDPARRDAAWRFIVFLSDNMLDWAEGGQVPVRLSQLESERFAGMPAQTAFATQLPHIVYVPRVPFIFEFLTEYDAAVERALRGSLEPGEALRDAAGRVDRAIARFRDAEARAGDRP
jgi:multiple sugar transport system substrate-binding protein